MICAGERGRTEIHIEPAFARVLSLPPGAWCDHHEADAPRCQVNRSIELVNADRRNAVSQFDRRQRPVL